MDINPEIRERILNAAVSLHSIRGLATLIFQHCPLFYCKVIALK